MGNINNTIEYINKMATEDPVGFIERTEARYDAILDSVANKVASNGSGHQLILLAGPSSSGKTTSARKIAEKLERMGRKAYSVSMDDFYLNKEDAPKLPDGSKDFESVHSLDIPLIKKTMSDLLSKGEADIPHFDFKISERTDEWSHMTIGKKDIVILEGLHALNPLISDDLPKDSILKIYINVSSRIYDENEKIVLNKRNMRFVRRLVRDFYFRNSSVENTYGMWGQVSKGEDMYLFPLRDTADIKINTIHLYEPCIFKDIALDHLKSVDRLSPFYSDAQRLINSLERFVSIDAKLLPRDSLIVREFIGDFHYDK
ncbi:MAG: nucleoside kinase [Clostridiales bacterium]|nr:nucleoside kinase [Clostridiales bacterium]